MSKIVSAVHHTPMKSEKPAQVEALLTSQAQLLQKTPGFLSYRLLRPLTPEDTYSVLTFWQSTKHYRAAVEQNRIDFA